MKAVMSLKLRLHHQRSPDIHAQSSFGTLKERRRHANHSVRMLVQVDGVSNDLRVAAEEQLPGAIAEHYDGSSARLVAFLWLEEPAQYGAHTEDIEIIRRSKGGP